jgi:diacylglycerol kinase (ATP)
MKTRLIVNPVAGTDSAPDHMLLINERLRTRVGLMDIVMTVGEGDAARAAESAVRDGYDHLLVGGGDGTLNEVLNGAARVPGGLGAITLGVIPLGTGNDFATAIGLSEEIDEALTSLLESNPVSVDVGQLNDRYFLNVSAGGFVAEVSDAVGPGLKTVAGKLAYLIGGASVMLDHEPVRARVKSRQGATAEMQLHMFAVCNSRLVGGGRLIAPNAVIDDGLLDVCLVEAMPTLEFIALLRRISSGEHVTDDRVTYFQTTDLDLAFDRRIKVNTDGQVLESDRCRYRVLHRALRVLMPQNAVVSSADA